MEQHKRSSSTDEAPTPTGKRLCTSTSAALLRLGSLESSATHPGGGRGQLERAAAAAVAAASMPRFSCSPASFLPAPELDTPSSEASHESGQAPWQAPSATASPDTCAATSCFAREAGIRAGARAMQQPLQERPRKQQPEAAAQEPARACPHPLVSPAYLAELAAANAVIERLPLPGGLSFYPVHPSCALLPLCCAYGVSPAAICLGASYFQRLLAGNESLRAAALQSGYFSQCADGAVVMHARAGPAEEAALIYCACVYLGCKVTDGVRYAGQLSHMMSTLLSANICTSMATDLEMRCLKGLNWRLGPYCCRSGHQAGEW